MAETVLITLSFYLKLNSVIKFKNSAVKRNTKKMKNSSPFGFHYGKFVHPCAAFCQVLPETGPVRAHQWSLSNTSVIIAQFPNTSPAERFLMGQIFPSYSWVQWQFSKSSKENLGKVTVNRSVVVQPRILAIVLGVASYLINYLWT